MSADDPGPPAAQLDEAMWAKLRDAMLARRADVRRCGLRMLAVFALYLAVVAWAAHWTVAVLVAALVLVPSAIYTAVQRWKLRRLRREIPDKKQLALTLYARLLDIEIGALVKWRTRAKLVGVVLAIGVAAVIALTAWEILGDVPLRSADITYCVFALFQATYAVLALLYVAMWRRHRTKFSQLVQEREALATVPGAPPMPPRA